MKNMIFFGLIALATNAFGYQPLTCDEASESYTAEKNELKADLDKKLADCELLVENAGFACIQAAAQSYDQALVDLDDKYREIWLTCWP